MPRISLPAVLACMVSAVAVHLSPSPYGKNYSMVLVGGGLEDENEEIWNTIISLGGGVGKARFGVISAASEDPCCDADSSWVYYRDLLTRYGAAEVYYIPVTVDSKENNTSPEVVAHVKTLTGFFFGGGDQQRIVYSYYNQNERVPSDVLVAIKETLLRTGGVVAGTSAGTDIQTSKVMITCGNSYEGLASGSRTYWETVELPDETILTAYGPGGIGLFNHGLLDTHFANRGRQGRMIQLLMDTGSLPLGYHRAFGVDENTALVVTGCWNERVGKVIGQRGVLIMDTSFASGTRGIDNSYSDIRGILLSRLSEGDEVDMESLMLKPAAYKTPLNGREIAGEGSTSADIFAEGTFEFDKVTQSLVSHSASYSTGLTASKKPEFKVTIGKSWVDSGLAYDFTATSFDGVDPNTGVYGYTYGGLWMNIVKSMN